MSGANVLHKIDNGERELDKEADVEIEDYVYINSDGKAEKADASSINTMPCIGRVVRVFGDKCIIKRDFVEETYADVVSRTVFFISSENPGQITDNAPIAADSVIQNVGMGIKDDRILIHIDPSNIIIRS